MQIFVDKNKLLTSGDIPINYHNLYDGTADFSGENWTNLDAYTNDNWVSNFGNQSRQKKGSWLGLSKPMYLYANQFYTLSASVFVDENSSSGFIGFYGNDDQGNNSLPSGIAKLYFKDAPHSWVTVKQTFSVPKSGTYNVRFESNDDQVNIHWADLMLNKGSIALDWNYSLNDLRAKMGGVKPSYRLYYATSVKEVA